MSEATTRPHEKILMLGCVLISPDHEMFCLTRSFSEQQPTQGLPGAEASRSHWHLLARWIPRSQGSQRCHPSEGPSSMTWGHSPRGDLMNRSASPWVWGVQGLGADRFETQWLAGVAPAP